MTMTASDGRPDPYLRDVKRVDLGRVDKAAFDYAAGLTDADGCFKILGCKIMSLQFTLTQALKGIEALVYLHDKFGGSINLQLAGDEKNQRAYSWNLNGVDATRFVTRIVDSLLLKKREALRFLDFPNQNLHVIPIIAENAITKETLTFDTLKDCQAYFRVHFAFQKREQIHWQEWIIKKSLSKKEIENITSARSQIAIELIRFKKEVHDDIPANCRPTAAYLGGFFDGDGCIDTSGKSGQHHQISQRSSAICDLYKRLFGGKVSKQAIGYRWDIFDGADEFLQGISTFVKGKKQQVDLVLAMKPGDGEKTHALLREMKGKGKMKTAKIDRFTSGTGTTYTTVKELPKGVFYFRHDPTLIYVQIQHKKRVYVLGNFKLEDLDQAVALYAATKRSIRMNENFVITEFVKDRGGKRNNRSRLSVNPTRG